MRPEWRKKYLLQDMTYDQVREWLQQTDTIILPTAAIEQHGPHCPMATDWYQIMLVACAASERANVPVAAGLWFGVTPYHMGKPGTITLREETFEAVLYDIARSLVHHGFKRFIAMCGHLGNYAGISQVARRLKYDTGAIMINYTPFFVAEAATADLFGVPLQEFRTPPRHGGEIETGGVMAWNPDLIQMERRGHHRVNTPAWLTPSFGVVGANEVTFKGFRLGMPLEHYEYCSSGAIGNSQITQEQAEQAYAAAIDYTVELIEEMKKIDVKLHQQEFVQRA